jgi:hypothetical protein
LKFTIFPCLQESSGWGKESGTAEIIEVSNTILDCGEDVKARFFSAPIHEIRGGASSWPGNLGGTREAVLLLHEDAAVRGL